MATSTTSLFRPSFRLVGAVLGVIALAVLATLVATTSAPPITAPYPVRTAVLTFGNVTGTVAPGFFGVNVQEIGIGGNLLSARLNATPISFFRFSPAGEATDQITGLTYSANGIAAHTVAFTDPQFVGWCRARSCQAMMMVPAEVNNSSLAAATVAYVETTLGFHPAYWSIGNEPQTWRHWGIPWTQWRTTDNSTPSPAQYGAEVRLYALAIHAVDPTAKLIGIESSIGGGSADPWFHDVVAAAGPYLAAVSYHTYPGGAVGPRANLTNFYGALLRGGGLAGGYAATVASVTAACPTCRIPVFVDEFDSALTGGYNSELEGYPNAVFVASSLAAAIHANMPRVAYFDLANLDPTLPYAMLFTGGGPRPTYTLYASILANLTLGEVHATGFAGGVPGLTSLYLSNGTARSLLIVNANPYIGVQFGWAGSVGNSTSTGEWAWSPSAADPLFDYYLGPNQPTTAVVPPQGILLVNLD